MTLSPPHAESATRRALPRLLAAALLFAAGPARAEDAAASAIEIERLEADVKRAYIEERYEDAFETLKTLYALSREPRDACNAGRTAYRLGRMAVAVELLSVCEAMVRGGGARALSVRDKGVVAGAMADLVTAKPRVGRIVVTVNKSGATIALDGEVIGASPLAREIPIDPGRHRVRVTLGGASEEVSEDVRAGRAWPVRVVFEEPTGRAPRAGEPLRAREAFWRAPHFWASVGVGALGAVITAVAQVKRSDAWDEMKQTHRYTAVSGCGEAGGAIARACAAHRDAASDAEAAGEVMGAAIAATLVLAPAVFAIGGWMKGPPGALRGARIQAAPTVGGAVIRGTF